MCGEKPARIGITVVPETKKENGGGRGRGRAERNITDQSFEVQAGNEKSFDLALDKRRAEGEKKGNWRGNAGRRPEEKGGATIRRRERRGAGDEFSSE